MESLLLSIDYRDPIWIAAAFVFGIAATQIGLPALVGFLAAGFVLNALGAEGGAFLGEMADLGVTLMLFTIGLKLKVKQLLRPEIWAVGSLHLLLITVLASGLLMLFAVFGLPLFVDISPANALLIGFALSFSSTVFAVKVLEEQGELGSFYGHVAIGVLIIQDIAAVVFLAATSAKLPSPWALALITALMFGRPLIINLLKRAGHGELLVLLGLVLALGGASLFEMVKLKGDLGALVIGALIANHPRAEELAKSLLGFKDLFLVGFFLSIGMTGLPTLEALVVAVIFLAMVPVKVGLFFWMFTRFRLRARPASLASLSLANYSEFGLIVMGIAVQQGWLDTHWLIAFALMLAMSFVIASPLNSNSNRLYVRFRDRLRKFERQERLLEDMPIDLGTSKIAVFGLGSIGTGAYDAFIEEDASLAIGFDFDPVVAKKHREEGRNVLPGDPTNPDFWLRIEKSGEIDMALLCLPTHQANLKCVKLMRDWGFTGRIAVTAVFDDEIQELLEAGADTVFDVFAQAGAGFANHIHTAFALSEEVK